MEGDRLPKEGQILKYKDLDNGNEDYAVVHSVFPDNEIDFWAIWTDTKEEAIDAYKKYKHLCPHEVQEKCCLRMWHESLTENHIIIGEYDEKIKNWRDEL